MNDQCLFAFPQDQAQLSQVVNFLCKIVSPCHEKEAKPEGKGAEEEEVTAEEQKKEETEESLVNVSELDVESFQRLVVSARSVANTRPSNLAKYTILPGQQTAEGKSVNSEEFIKEPLCFFIDSLHRNSDILRVCYQLSCFYVGHSACQSESY